MLKITKRALAVFLIFFAVALPGAPQKILSHASLGLADQERSDEGQLPIADYAAPEPAGPAERAKMKAKSRRYGGKKIKEDPRVSIFTEGEGLVERLPPLPAAQSDAVIVGEVASAKAYLAEGKSGIYSEFTISVEKVFKSGGVLAPGGILIAEREGGAVRFPSGRVQRYTVSGERMPKVGSRYVLFLKCGDLEQNYLLLTGYELRAGQVSPMDDVSRHAAYKGMSRDAFIDAVLSAVADTSQVAPEKVRKDR